LITITVCIGSSCHLKCSYDVVNELQRLVLENNLNEKVTIKASFCLGNCTGGVCVKVNDGETLSVSKDNVDDFFNEHIIKNL
jgi:NADH:ubiquinone oxidoreductase subunit E